MIQPTIDSLDFQDCTQQLRPDLKYILTLGWIKIVVAFKWYRFSSCGRDNVKGWVCRDKQGKTLSLVSIQFTCEG